MASSTEPSATPASRARIDARRGARCVYGPGHVLKPRPARARYDRERSFGAALATTSRSVPGAPRRSRPTPGPPRRINPCPTSGRRLVRAWQPRVDGREGRELRVRLGLVPVSGARPVVGAPVGVAVLDAHPDGLAKAHRILDVEAVHRGLSPPVRPGRHGEPVIGRVVLLGRTPGGVEVVLRAGPMQRRRY